MTLKTRPAENDQLVENPWIPQTVTDVQTVVGTGSTRVRRSRELSSPSVLITTESTTLMPHPSRGDNQRFPTTCAPINGDELPKHGNTDGTAF